MLAAVPAASPSAHVVVVLGLLTAFAPLSTTMYAPGMPAMAADLEASASATQLTISALTIGLAIGQLVAGPLSDRLGRRRPLAIGLAVYVGASLLCALAPSAPVLIAARVLQGVAGAAGIVIGRAIVRDVASGAAAARLFSLLVLVSGVTPVVAPVLGGQVLELSSWRWIFVAQGAVGLLVLVAAAALVAETLPPARRRPERPLAVARRAAGLLRDGQLRACALTCACTYGAMLIGIAGSGFVFQRVYGLSPQAGGLALATGAAGMIVASRVGARAVPRAGSAAVLRAGVLLSLTAGALAVVAVASDAGAPLLVVALFASFASHGLTLPNANALALQEHPGAAGSASAALGVVQYTVGAVAAPLAGVAGEDTALPMALAILGLALAAAAASTRVRRET